MEGEWVSPEMEGEEVSREMEGEGVSRDMEGEQSRKATAVSPLRVPVFSWPICGCTASRCRLRAGGETSRVLRFGDAV